MKEFFLQNIINFKSFYVAMLASYIITSLVIVAIIPQYAPFIIVILCLIPFAWFVLFTEVHVIFLLYVATIPFVQHASFAFISLGDFKITPHMIFQLFLIISLLSTYILNRSNDKLIYSNTDKVLFILFLFSIFPLMIGYMFPVNHTKRWLLFYTGIIEPIVFYFSIRYLLNSKRLSKKSLLLALLCTSFASVLIAFMEFSSIGFDPITIFSSRMRFGFGYHNTNLFGIHSAILFPLTVYMLTDKQFSQYRVLALSSFIILLILSILCFNRGTILVLGLQIFLLFFNKQNRRLIYFMIIGFGILTIIFSEVLVFYILRFVAGGGMESTPTLIDTSASLRFEAWKVGALVLLYYPLGIGGASFQHMWELYGIAPNVYLGTPHQLLLSIGVDYGIPSLLAFLTIFFFAVKKTKKLYSENRDAYALFGYLLISLIGFGIYGLITDGELSHLTGNTAPNNGYTILLFTMLAMLEHEYSVWKSQKSNR